MLKMSVQLENIVNAYKTLSKIPSISGGKLSSNGKKITAKWSVRNIDKGKTTKYVSNYSLDDSLNVIAESDFGVDVSNELLSAVSPKETFKALIREEKSGKENKKQYLEVWNKNTLAHCIDLTALDIHGDVYADAEFGSLDWTHDETALVYIAEKKLQKSEPFIKRKGEEKPKSNGSGESLPTKGEEFVYKQDWGEQLVGKHLSVIVVCRLKTETFTILEGLPVGCCPGQVRFTPDGGSVVGVAWQTEPRRLGLIFCTNRPSFIFTLTLDGAMRKLSKEGVSVRSPRITTTGELVWLQRPVGGPHHACHELVIWKEHSNLQETIISMVENETKISNNESFYGIYCQNLPGKCFSNDGKRIILSTSQQNEVRSYVVDIDGGRIVDISNRSSPGSTMILDVKSDIVLAACSSMTTPGQLYTARLPSQGNEDEIKWVRVSEPQEVPGSVATASVHYLQLEHPYSTDTVKSFTAIYFAPKVVDDKKLPLIVWPHGGPHSNFVNAYSLEAALFNLLGFASLQVNYRGSTGAGQDSIYFLPKRIGDSDVKDCKYATDEVLMKFNVDEKKMCLFGGSHGGFLVTHLSGQYPDVYSVVVSRNPVIDIASMFNTTDIADWYQPLEDIFLPQARLSNKTFIQGIASLRINYRGSTGHGDANVRCLIGHVGDYDISDCHLALITVLEREKRLESVVLYGGSYGGLVAGHLAGRYPDTFKCMVLRNPLIDLATKGYYADNVDGCAVEAGFDFTEHGPVSEEQLVAMRRQSPLVHVHKVRAATALMLGGGDRRVPYYQGLDYARRLKANGVNTRIYMYDDNHSLSSLPAEMDNLINSANWFLTHLQS